MKECQQELFYLFCIELPVQPFREVGSIKIETNKNQFFLVNIIDHLNFSGDRIWFGLIGLVGKLWQGPRIPARQHSSACFPYIEGVVGAELLPSHSSWHQTFDLGYRKESESASASKNCLSFNCISAHMRPRVGNTINFLIHKWDHIK